MERCQFGASKTAWFRYTYDQEGMRVDSRTTTNIGENVETRHKVVQTQGTIKNPEQTEEWQEAFNTVRRPQISRKEGTADMTRTTIYIMEGVNHPV